MIESGILYVVATPIGNLSDVSARMQAVLSKVNVIVAEDTRHTKRLLQSMGINNRLLSYHKFNEAKQTHVIIEQLQQGDSVALVSDAGTPGISDPGSYLVKAAHENNIDVRTIPGPCAVSAALSISGFDASYYSFHGFLSAKSSQRQSYLQSLIHHHETLVFYESPKRILSTIKDMRLIFGDERLVCFCRELTKIFETAKVFTLEALSDFIESDSNQEKGEIVIIVKGLEKQAEDADSEADITVTEQLSVTDLTQALSPHLSGKDILAVIQTLNPSIKKNSVYKTIIELVK